MDFVVSIDDLKIFIFTINNSQKIESAKKKLVRNYDVGVCLCDS